MANDSKNKKVGIDLSLVLRKIACYLLAIIMGLSVVFTVAVSVTMGVLKSESFVQKRFEEYNEELLDEVNTSISLVAEETGLPSKAYTDAIQVGHIQTALHRVAYNIVEGYETDYTDSTYLYGYYRTGIYNYCKENAIPLTEEELVRDACFAVDIFNDTVGDESTNSILIFSLLYTQNPIIGIIAAIIAFGVSFVLLGVLTYGRHKKYDYMGAGLIVGGETLIVLPAFALIMKYTSTLHFTDIDVYNMGIADVLNDTLKIFIAIGFVVLVIGIVIILINYRYFKRKSNILKTEHDIRTKLMDEQRAQNEALFVQMETEELEKAIEDNDKEIEEK